MKKYLIVGLGNIGSEYSNTRHNIGFQILDVFAKASNIFFTPDRLADKAEISIKGRKLILIKPSTYMNLSGKAINYWMQQEKIPIENVFVLVDEIALEFGAIRIKGKGSDGGHNGLKSIQDVLQTNQYPRLRFGLGSDFARGKQVDFVLGDWTSEEEKLLPERIIKACEAIKSFCLTGLSNTMNTYNNK